MRNSWDGCRAVRSDAVRDFAELKRRAMRDRAGWILLAVAVACLVVSAVIR